LYPGETNNPNPTLTVSNKVNFGSADSHGMACGGAIILSANAIVHSSIITNGALTTGDGAMIFGDIDCVEPISLNFNGNIVSQGAVTIDANTILRSGTFAGDLLETLWWVLM
jgi:hypothetical protein